MNNTNQFRTGGYNKAFELTCRVFDRFEAPTYPQNGRDTFYNSLQLTIFSCLMLDKNR